MRFTFIYSNPERERKKIQQKLTSIFYFIGEKLIKNQKPKTKKKKIKPSTNIATVATKQKTKNKKQSKWIDPKNENERIDA